jgi:cysteine desulfurase family protein (TIGR01976 family)
MTGAASRAIGSPAAKTVDEIRAEFPAFERRHHGEPVAYFDGPGGTQVPVVVANAMADYLFHHNANTHWRYATSRETDALIMDARETLARFLNGRADEIAFGQNMTSLTFHLGRAIGRRLGKGDEILITELDHHANVAPWRALERERGVTIRSARMRTEDGRLDWDDFAAKLTPATRLVAIGAASNALGTITDVKRATQLAHAAGAWTFVDAVHYAPHELVDVQDIGCDFLACSAYKFYGPHIGILWGRKALIEELDVPRLDPAPSESPEKLETGTQSHESMVGAAAAVNFLAWTGGASDVAGVSQDRPAAPPARAALQRAYAVLHERAAGLLAMLWSGLERMDGVTMYGPPPDSARTPTVAFTLRGVSTDHIAETLSDRGLFVSNGDFYAQTVMERLGLLPDGVVRVGCSCYTTADEIDRLLAEMRGLAAGGR